MVDLCFMGLPVPAKYRVHSLPHKGEQK